MPPPPPPPSPPPLDILISEMLSLQKSLPPRPSLPELDIALDAIAKADDSLSSTLKEISLQKPPDGVAPMLFAILQKMRREAEVSKAKEKKSAFQAVVDLEGRHRRYDGWIRKAHAALSTLISGSGAGAGGGEIDDSAAEVGQDEDRGEDEDEDEVEGKPISAEHGGAVGRRDSATSVLDATWEFPPSAASSTPTSDSTSSSAHARAKLLPHSAIATGAIARSDSFSRVAAGAIARSDSFSRVVQSLTWSQDRKQQVEANRLQDGKHPKMLSTESAVTDKQEEASREEMVNKRSRKDGDLASLLNSALKKGGEMQTCIDMRGRKIEWVPETIGKMPWLTELHLSGNLLSSLPDSISDLGSLSVLDVSTNRLTVLPESVGRLTNLTILSIDNNKIEELPWTIGQCTALVELHASFNQLKALPEATGKLSCLRVLDVHWNKLGSLPSTIGSLSSLVDLNASFNEIRCIPDGLCYLTSLVSINLASNFTELRELPLHIGNLCKLKVLNLSCNQLKVLPDSFVHLTNIEQLDLSENNWRFPPKHIVDQGKDAVFKFMGDHVAEKEKSKLDLLKSPRKKKKSWRFLFFTCGKFSVAQEKLVA